ncbi:hypothetical protein MMC07_000974 [Pseudocyphellaria aurata]|nr:hypothetical protein [Pseudocyphellaria aurata]
MSDLLRQETGYNHRGVQIAVERWISIRPTENFDELKDNHAFIEAIDKFAERWQYSQNEAAGRIAANKAKKEEIMNARHARRYIKLEKAADDGIAQCDNSSEMKTENTAPVDRQTTHLSAEDGIAGSFSRIIYPSINESQDEVRSEEQGKRQSEGWRKRRRSSGLDDDDWARLYAQFLELQANMNILLARLSKKLDDMKAQRKKRLLDSIISN